MNTDNPRGVYVISIAAEILDMHPQTLRKYERVGFIVPSRRGMFRFYSEEDITQLRFIKHLVEDKELNLAGVELALALRSKLLGLRSKLATEEEVDGTELIGAVDELLNLLGEEPGPGQE